MARRLAFFALLPFVLTACNQPTTTASASPSATVIVTASARASGSATASPRTSATQIELEVVVPESGTKAGINGIGWTVDVIARGAGPALDKVKPGIRGGGTTGRHPNFPGLIILLKSTSQGGQAGNPNVNLAGLFQIIGLPNTFGPLAGISSVGASPSATPASVGASGATVATRSTSSTDSQTAEATWFVDQTLWGTDIDVELTAFVVDGDAPDTVSDRSSLKIVSNEVIVRFHINGGGIVPFGSLKPTGSTAPTAGPSGSARPSGSPSSTP